MKLAIAQINCNVGDLAGNAAKIAEYSDRARQAGASLVVTPELALCGYPPEDLLLRDGFYQACDAVVAELALRVRGVTLVVGHPRQTDEGRYN
ncbi:MAG TPA: nitrilase-related carbon-nitrogen hydrolase, partial [Burkholderiales bacterium]